MPAGHNWEVVLIVLSIGGARDELHKGGILHG